MEFYYDISVTKHTKGAARCKVCAYYDESGCLSLCQAYMYLAGTDDVCSSAVPGSKSERKRIRVRPHDGYSVSWPIIPLKTGNFTIRVIARTSIGGDIVEKTLYVVVSG